MDVRGLARFSARAYEEPDLAGEELPVRLRLRQTKLVQARDDNALSERFQRGRSRFNHTHARLLPHPADSPAFSAAASQCDV